MSRTDKDAPPWVSATWWTPTHMGCDAAQAIGPARRRCDLPERPHVKTGRPDRRVWQHCHWNPQWERRSFYRHEPRWFINHVWTARERVAVRDECLRAAKEHRGGGRVDVEPTVRQARHGARWLWT